MTTASADNLPGVSGVSGSALLLLLLDSRSPAGGHNHSAGMEPAIAAGWVRDLADVEAFCRGRLLTSGRVAAAFAAAAADLWLGPPDLVQHPTPRNSTAHKISGADPWAELEAEFEARTPSEAMRAASHQLGRGLARLVRAMLPAFEPPWGSAVPHHPIVLGAAVAAAGGTPELAARAAALGAVSAPASAAVRLLGLDPFAVQAMLAQLASEIDLAPSRVPRRPLSTPESGQLSTREGEIGGLPAASSPALDLLADFHLTTEVRLFAS